MAAGGQGSNHSDRDVLITGVGLVSSLGEGLDAHWAVLTSDAPQSVVDETSFAPYGIHPICDIDYSRQGIAKGDLRQMGDWQRIGTYAAGLALDDAGIKDNNEFLDRTHIICAAGNGERDPEADRTVLEALKDEPAWPARLNELLLANLRPTAYLGEQSQLLAGNIAIVHKAVGGSRTYKGEETAGVQIVEDALNRIRSGQNDIILVGAAYNAARWDQLLIWELNGRAGIRTGSMGAFMVLESRAHAEARGAKAYAVLKEASATGRPETKAGVATLSRGRLAALFGRGIEADFPLGIALAALMVSRGEVLAGLFDTPVDEAASLAVAGWPSAVGEGLARLDKVEA
jgi:3-oxoacyl-[acyl-carrier-protein] synthase II